MNANKLQTTNYKPPLLNNQSAHLEIEYDYNGVSGGVLNYSSPEYGIFSLLILT